MSYRVSYDGKAVNKTNPTAGTGSKLRRWLIAGILVLICAAALRYTGASQQILQWMLPGDPETTADALQLLTRMLSQGESLSAAVTAFCRRILEGAQLV